MTKLTIIAPERQPHKRFTPVCAVAHDSAPEAGCGRAVLFGPKVIIAEYAITVAAGLLVAVLSLRAGLHVTHARWQIVLGLYLLSVASGAAGCSLWQRCESLNFLRPKQVERFPLIARIIRRRFPACT